MTNKIKNIVFDLGGVLIDLDRDACVRAFAEIGFPQAASMLDSYKQSGMFLAIDEGRATTHDFYDYIRRESRRNTSDEEIQRAFCQFLTGLPVYKLEMLRELRKRFNVYMLSNTNAVMMPYITEQYFTGQGHPVETCFDRLFLSYEMKLHKPDEEIFHAMLRQGGFAAEDSLFIDDSQANVDSARRIGFETYLAKPREDFRSIFDEL